MRRRISLWDRARSLRHAARLALSERTGRFTGAAAEAAAGWLDLEPPAAARVAALSQRHGVCFESQQEAAGALHAYEYLDFLDQALDAWGQRPPRVPVMHDVGCASFGYAAALVALCRPGRLVGVELEGYRRLRGGVNRAGKAAANVARLSHASFVIADYTRFAERADLITAFFPFVTPTPVLGWRLPLSVLRPRELFLAVRRNLNPGGRLWMVNQGETEETLAREHAGAAGLEPARRHVCTSVIRPRAVSPILSEWQVP